MNKTIILTTIIFLFALPFLSAGINYDNYALKWQMCGALNFSGEVCDTWWGSFADFPKNATIEINWTEVDNKIATAINNYYNKNETDAKFSSYYNKTEIDQKNFSINSSVNFDINYWTSDDRNTNERLMTEIEVKKIISEINPIKLSEAGLGGGYLQFIIIGIIVLAIIIGFIVSKIYGKKQIGYQTPTFDLMPQPKLTPTILPRAKAIPTDNQIKKVEIDEGKNDWVKLVNKVRKEGNLSYKEALRKASKIYKKKDKKK